MPSANVIFSNDFSGVGYPTFDPWPYFEILPGQSVFISPCVDGRNHGLATRTHNLYSILRSTQYPGRSDYKLDLTAKWSNPGFAGDREVGLCARMKDRENFLVARLRSMGASSPELRLFKVVNGTATQLGSTYTGSDISAARLAVGVQFRIRVEDLKDGSGETRVSIYTASSVEDNGDLRIDWTGDVGELRGNWTGGIEIGRLWKGSDILVSSFQCLDFGDEWTEDPPVPGQGWQVELDGAIYSTDALQALDPPIELVSVQQEYGLAGNTCELRVKGKFHTGLLRNGQDCRIWHDGLAVFRGKLVGATISASPDEMQVFRGADAATLARQVNVSEDDCSGTLHFNVYDREADEYRRDRQNLTIGAIIKVFFDSYTEGTEKLRFYGAAPASGAAYVQSELNLLDAVIPDIAVSGNFTEVILTLISYMPKYQLWINPADLKWHFKDVTNLTGETVTLTSEWASLSIEPDWERPYTAILWRGAKKEADDGVTLSLRDGSLKPAWTTSQENSWRKDKAKKSHLTLRIVNAGTYPVNGGPTPNSLVYVDVVIGTGQYQSQMDEDDWRGAVATFSDDAGARFVTKNTSSRISLSAPLWSGDTPPAVGSFIYLSLVDEEAMWWLSMQGVGRGVVLFPPVSICPAYAPLGYKDGNLKNLGQCGEAWVTGTGDDGSGYAQQYQYKVHIPTQAQSDAGFCDIHATIAEKPKPPMGLINYLPPPGGSPPVGACSAGQPPIAAQVDIQIKVSSTEDCAPQFRIPAEEGTYEGEAYSVDGGTPKPEDWGVQRVYVVDDPDFIDSSIQQEGLEKAAQAWLDFYSQKFYAFNITLATPWFHEVPDFISAGLGPGGAVPPGLRPPGGATTTRWALNGGKKVSLASSKRTTGYEAVDLCVYSVKWDVPGNKTILQAGSAVAILKADAATLAKTQSNKVAAKRAAKMLKAVEDFRNKMLAKAADRVGGMQAGAIPGCDVEVIDHNTRTVKNVEIDDEQKKGRQNYDTHRKLLTDILFHGVENTHPGSQIQTPGLDGPEGKQVVAGAGPTLGSYADHRLAFQGPDTRPNGARSKYGGLIGADSADSYNPPEYLGKYAGFIFRAKPNLAETSGGGIGIEFSPVDGSGAPTGAWTDLTSARDLPQGTVPWSAVTEGSIDYQLRQQTAELARALGRVEDELGRLQQPGDETTSHPDGVPADLATALRTPGIANPYLQLVQHSFSDPGGLVYEGPFTEDMKNHGAGPGTYWRVASPENVLIRVEPASPGTGTNGGNWAPALASGAAFEYATALRVEHKQLHARDLADDQTQPGRAPAAPSDDPFCFYGQAGRVLGVVPTTGAGGIVPLPVGARGTPLLTAHLVEDPASGQPAGRILGVRFATATKASPWSSVTGGSAGAGLTSDGSQSGQGVFRAPGGAVPPGLRTPSDYAVSLQTLGGSSYTGPAILRGIDVDVAVVEGGYWIRWKQRVGIDEVWGHNAPWYSDIGVIADLWALDFTKGWGESCEMSDNWAVELNAPLGYDELCTMADEWTVELNP